MYLANLSIAGVRGLATKALQFSPGLNWIHGANGAGKTSLLEAIHVLSLGRSFRTGVLERVIGLKTNSFLVRGNLLGSAGEARELAIEKKRRGRVHYRLDGVAVTSAAPLARCLPLQLMHAGSDSLLLGAAAERRGYLDWGAFHVEPGFLLSWRSMQRALQQRNAWLRRAAGSHVAAGSSAAFVGGALDSSFLSHAHAVHVARVDFFYQLAPILDNALAELLGEKNWRLCYDRGWRMVHDTLQGALSQAWERDLAVGHTSCGPHRADLCAFYQNVLAKYWLSRGQLRRFVFAMLLARARWFEKVLALRSDEASCCGQIFLFDDLHAALDNAGSLSILRALAGLSCQVFVTSTRAPLLAEISGWRHVKRFHVEPGDQGAIIGESPE